MCSNLILVQLFQILLPFIDPGVAIKTKMNVQFLALQFDSITTQYHVVQTEPKDLGTLFSPSRTTLNAIQMLWQDLVFMVKVTLVKMERELVMRTVSTN